MNSTLLKKLVPHLLAIVFFLGLALVYFSPIMQGKTLKRHDMTVWKSTAQEANQFKKETGEKTLWTNSLFGGMPTYLINAERSILIHKVHKILRVFKTDPQAQVFLYLLGFYIAMLLFGVSPWLAIIGSIAFAFSSYFFIIIEAGHSTKAYAIAYMPPIIGGLYYIFNKNALKGSIIMAFFLALQINSNHFQITYYTALICLVFGIVWLINAIRNKELKQIIKPVSFSFLAAVFALAINVTSIYLTYEYGNYSMRGPSELTHDEQNQTSGLDKDYATSWSYGIDETFTFLIPNFKGGASGGSLTESSETYKLFEQAQGKKQARQVIKQMPLYWGTQPMTSGPVYIGAFICFLFVLGLFLVKGPVKWWLLAATILSILLGWGKNFMPFTEFFLDYFPGYNKFRTVSMTLVIAELTIPIIAVLGLKEALSGNIKKQDFKKAMYWAFGITGGLSLFFALFSGMFSYESLADGRMQPVLVDALKIDRQSMLRDDAFRAFGFIIFGALMLWFGYNKKLDKKYLYPVLAILLLLDMWTVNKRYLNNDDFVSKKVMSKTFDATKADKIILEDNDPNYRVVNIAVSTFNDATTSEHHKSIGGYHGAKMRRYQELIDFHISRELQATISKLQAGGKDFDYYSAVQNNQVLNMLNTKYYIINPESYPLQNANAFGNAWFVNNVQLVENADQEINVLAKVNLKNTAVIDTRFKEIIGIPNTIVDSAASIKLDVYKPNYLKYSTNSKNDQIAVFSEIYYPKGWVAYLDGEEATYFRANYILRAMNIPAGEHVIEWHFKPKSYEVGMTISVVSSIFLLLLIVGLAYVEVKKGDSNNEKVNLIN